MITTRRGGKRTKRKAVSDSSELLSLSPSGSAEASTTSTSEADSSMARSYQTARSSTSPVSLVHGGKRRTSSASCATVSSTAREEMLNDLLNTSTTISPPRIAAAEPLLHRSSISSLPSLSSPGGPTHVIVQRRKRGQRPSPRPEQDSLDLGIPPSPISTSTAVPSPQRTRSLSVSRISLSKKSLEPAVAATFEVSKENHPQARAAPNSSSFPAPPVTVHQAALTAGTTSTAATESPPKKKKRLLLVQATLPQLAVPAVATGPTAGLRAKDRKLQAQALQLAQKQGLQILQQASLKERKPMAF